MPIAERFAQKVLKNPRLFASVHGIGDIAYELSDKKSTVKIVIVQVVVWLRIKNDIRIKNFSQSGAGKGLF